MPSGKRVEVNRVHAPTYFRKAEQQCKMASHAFATEKYDAAVILAIHAGISAVDAICIAIAGVRSNDPDHNKAADLLRAVGGKAFDDQAQRLLRLLALKNRIEYENKRATRNDADQCTRRCSNLIDSARNELTKARLIR